MLLSVTVFSYTTYRITRHMNARDFLVPAGVAPVPYTTMDCNGVKIIVPVKGLQCGNSPVPCTTNDCRDFVPRGTDVKQGFAAPAFNPGLIK